MIGFDGLPIFIYKYKEEIKSRPYQPDLVSVKNTGLNKFEIKLNIDIDNSDDLGFTLYECVACSNQDILQLNLSFKEKENNVNGSVFLNETIDLAYYGERKYFRQFCSENLSSNRKSLQGAMLNLLNKYTEK